nr:lipopolysaccharide-induced tumor necrosis factor-alpha factor homolog [Nomia melanderi]
MYARIRDAPPTYSTIFGRTTRNWSPFRSTNQSSFIAPIPPPSYAQAQGICFASCSADQLLSPNANRLWTTRPTTAFCPRCTTLVVTTVEVRQSIITHVTAFALFLCGCWPCCTLPYCMNTCKNIDHYCPACRTHLGTYRPC